MRIARVVASVLLAAAFAVGGRGVAIGAASAGSQSAVPAATTAEWPRFRGEESDGISREKGINKNWAAHPPQLLWKQAMTDGGYSGPSVANGVVYIIDHDDGQHIVRALDIKTGKEKWRSSFPDALTSNHGFARSTPTVDGDRVYTMSRLGKVHCFDARTGAVRWMKDAVAMFGAKRPQWDMAGSPLIDGNKVLVCVGGPTAALVAFNKFTGATVWTGGGSDSAGYASPFVATIGGVRQYICFFATMVAGVSTTDGKLLWSYRWVTLNLANCAAPLVIGVQVFITSGYGHGCAMIKVSNGSAQEVWANTEMQAHFSSPIYYHGYIYGTGDPGLLMCIDPKTGKALWKQKGFEKGGILAIDGTLLALCGSNGDLVMADLSPSAYKEIGRFAPLGDRSWTTPIAAEGKLIIRNQDTVACLDLK